MHSLHFGTAVQNDIMRGLIADCDRLAVDAEEIHYWANHFGVDETRQPQQLLEHHMQVQAKVERAKREANLEAKKSYKRTKTVRTKAKGAEKDR